MQWAELNDVKDRWLLGAFPATDEQLEMFIGDAEDTILAEYPAIESSITSGKITKLRLVKVVARVVIRHLSNPEGIRQVSSGTGPFTGSKTYGGDNPGEMYLTDDDRRTLEGKKKGARAGSVSMIPRYSAFHPEGVRDETSLWN